MTGKNKGEMIYERITEATKDGSPKSLAIDALAIELGMKPGTVAANYYRVARQQDGVRTRGSAPRAARGSVPVVVDEVVDRLEDVIGILIDLKDRNAGLEDELRTLRRIQSMFVADDE